jgi:hypothetical protein
MKKKKRPIKIGVIMKIHDESMRYKYYIIQVIAAKKTSCPVIIIDGCSFMYAKTHTHKHKHTHIHTHTHTHTHTRTYTQVCKSGQEDERGAVLGGGKQLLKIRTPRIALL